jgi:hypothetical protein
MRQCLVRGDRKVRLAERMFDCFNSALLGRRAR